MNVEPTILVLADGQPPEELASELERHHVFTEFTTPAALADVFDVVAPDLVLLFGRKHFDTTAAFLAHLPEERRVRLAVLAARSELASFRDVDRELVATVLSLDISTSALAARLATVALRLAQKIQERSRSVAPPAVTVVKPSLTPPRAPLLPKVSEPPRPRASRLPGREKEGASTPPVSMPISSGPPRPVMGARKSAPGRPPEPEPADDLSDRPTLVRDPLEQSVATELAFDDRPTIAGEAPLQVDASELELDSSPDSARETSVPESGKFPVAARSVAPAAGAAVVTSEATSAPSDGSSGGMLGGGGEQARSVLSEVAAPVLGGALPRESVAGTPGRLAAASSTEPAREGAQLPGGSPGGQLGGEAGSSAGAPEQNADRADDGSLGALESHAERTPKGQTTVAPPSGRRAAAILLGAGCVAAAAGFAWHTQRSRTIPEPVRRTTPPAELQGSQQKESPAASSGVGTPSGTELPDPGADRAEPPLGDLPSGPAALWRVPVEEAPSCKDLIAPPAEVNAVTVAFGNRAWDRARAALVRGDRKAAHVALCDAVQNHPQSLAVEGLVEHYLSLHSPEQARPWLATALGLRPERPRTIELEAILESQLGNEDAARKAWQRSVGIVETDTATTVRLSRMSAAEVDGLLRAGDFLRAESVARRAATLDDASAVAAAALASVWLATGQDALAALWVARAEQLDPKSPEAAVVRGDWHARAGDLPAARQSYERAIEFEPSNKAAWQKLGGMSGTKGKSASSVNEAASDAPAPSAAPDAPATAATEPAAAPAAVNPNAD